MTQPTDPTTETLQRVRRIETRLTQTMEHIGISPRTRKPTVILGNMPGQLRVAVPTLNTTLKEVLDVLPPGWSHPVTLLVDGKPVATLDYHA